MEDELLPTPTLPQWAEHELKSFPPSPDLQLGDNRLMVASCRTSEGEEELVAAELQEGRRLGSSVLQAGSSPLYLHAKLGWLAWQSAGLVAEQVGCVHLQQLMAFLPAFQGKHHALSGTVAKSTKKKSFDSHALPRSYRLI